MGLLKPPSAFGWSWPGCPESDAGHYASGCFLPILQNAHGNDKRQNDQVGTVMSWPPAGFVLCPCSVKPFEGLAYVFGPQYEIGRVVVSCCG